MARKKPQAGQTTYAERLKIVSGGQTGVDRAALDFALANDISHGGKCPKGRIAEDGVIPSTYQLVETATSRYPERTLANILESDATLIITDGLPLTGGTLLTQVYAERSFKPVLVIEEGTEVDGAGEKIRRFLREESVDVLNVAGPRGSSSETISGYVHRVLAETLLD